MIDWLELSPLLAWVVIESQLWTPFAKYAKVLPKMIGIQVRELKGEDSECQRFYQIGSNVSSQKWGVESAPVMLLTLLQKVYFVSFCCYLQTPDSWFDGLESVGLLGAFRPLVGTRTVTWVFLILKFLVSLRKQLLVSNIACRCLLLVNSQPVTEQANQINPLP